MDHNAVHNLNGMTPGYTVAITIVCICALAACMRYLTLRNKVVQQAEEIQRLEIELHELQAENDDAEAAMRASTDMIEVKRIAIEEMGLYYADEDQVRYFSMDGIGYTSQHAKIADE